MKIHGLMGGEFSNFFSKNRGSGFAQKKAGDGKIGGCFKKGGITYFYANPFQCYFSLSV